MIVDIIMLVVMLFFMVEIVLTWLVEYDYHFSFFFWMDVVGTVSMVWGGTQTHIHTETHMKDMHIFLSSCETIWNIEVDIFLRMAAHSWTSFFRLKHLGVKYRGQVMKCCWGELGQKGGLLRPRMGLAIPPSQGIIGIKVRASWNQWSTSSAASPHSPEEGCVVLAMLC